MKSAGVSGSIVLIATMQTVGLFPNSTIYAGAKAALTHAGRILAKENRGRGEVRVNIVSPGVMNAGMATVSIESGKYDRYLNEGSILAAGAVRRPGCSAGRPLFSGAGKLHHGPSICWWMAD